MIIRIAYELSEDVAGDNFHYIEVRYSPILHTFKGVTLKRAKKVGVKLRIIVYDIRHISHRAFKALNNLKLIPLTVSLGGTKFLAQHPYTITYSNVPVDQKQDMGITERIIRLSVGVENFDDII